MSAAGSHRWIPVAVSTAGRRVLADRATLAVTVAFYALIVIVVTALCTGAAEAGGGQIAGYSAGAVTWYLVASEAAALAVSPRLVEQVSDDIATGAVTAELARPVPPLAVRLAAQVGHMVPRLVACTAAGSIIALLLVGRPPSLAGAALAVPALVLATACNIVAQHGVAAAAFWVRDARSSWFVYQKTLFILGGMILPLEVLPGWLEAPASVLPFMAMAYVPARLASGHAEPGLLLVQVGWLAILSTVAAMAFAAGERRLQAVGG